MWHQEHRGPNDRVCVHVAPPPYTPLAGASLITFLDSLRGKDSLVLLCFPEFLARSAPLSFHPEGVSW